MTHFYPTLRWTLLAVCATFLVSTSAGAQPRFAAYVHGFTFGDDCKKKDKLLSGTEALNEKGERWLASGTPADWMGDFDALSTSSVTDGFVVLRHLDRDLYEEPSACRFDASREAMLRRFANEMRDHVNARGQRGAKADWVLVGHSQGGFVVRLLHDFFRRHQSEYPGMNVRGVLTAGSPMQGARPATVSYGYRPGYYNAQPIIDQLLKDVLEPPVADMGSSLVRRVGSWIFPFLGDIAFDFVYETLDLGSYATDGAIKLAEGTIRNDLHAMAVDKDAKDAIGPGGGVTKYINSAPNPPQFRAYVGAERVPGPVRVGSGASTKPFRPGLAPWVPPLLTVGDALLTEGADGQPRYNLYFAMSPDIINPGDENAIMKFYNDVHAAYRAGADYYRVRSYWTLGLSYVLGDHRKHARWKRGRVAIENLHAKTNQILRASRPKASTCSRRVKVCDDGPGSYGRGGLADVGVSGRERQCASGERPYRTVYYNCIVYVSDKTDGLLGTHYCKWNEDDVFGPGRSSVLYGDTEPGGGYNHAEVVYARRRYDDPEGAFRKGDLNPTMRDGKELVDFWFNEPSL